MLLKNILNLFQFVLFILILNLVSQNKRVHKILECMQQDRIDTFQ